MWVGRCHHRARRRRAPSRPASPVWVERGHLRGCRQGVLRVSEDDPGRSRYVPADAQWGAFPGGGGRSPRPAEPPGNRWGQRDSGQTVAWGRWSVGRVCSQERVGHPFERQFCRGSGCFLGVCFGGCSPVQSWVTGTSTGTRSWDGPVSCSPVGPGEPVGKAEV